MKQILLFVVSGALFIGATACGHNDSSSTSLNNNNESIEINTSDPEVTDEPSNEEPLTIDVEEGDDVEIADFEEYDGEIDTEDDAEETNWQKTKGVYRAAKDKMKRKKDEWKEEHADQIEDAKEKGRNLKEKTKKKVGNWLDRTRKKLEED